MRHTTHASRWATAGLLTALTLGTTLDGPLLGAGEIRMAIDGGRVTLSAIEAPLADVLAEWSRVGGTRFVGAETLGRETVTLRLVEADEADAIRLLLRSAAGYVAAPRRAGMAGAARYDRVTILAARRTPAPAPNNAARAPANETDAGGTPAGSGAVPGLLPMEELQRVLDAAAAANGPPASADAPTDRHVPVLVTPVPGIGAAAGRLTVVPAPEGR